MVFGEGPLGPVGGDHRRAQFLRQFDYLLGAAQHLYFLPHQDDRPLGLEQHLQPLLHLVGVALGYVRLPGGQHFDIGLCAQKIGGYLQFDGPGPAGLEPVEGLGDVVGDGLHLIDHGVPVGHRLEHTELVLGLVGGELTLADEFLLNVGGYL